MGHFNELSPEVAELLSILAEECGEVVQRIGKILRHGIQSTNPYKGTPNNVTLESELTDIFAVVGLLDRLAVISEERIRGGIPRKLARLRRPGILHHSSMLVPDPCIGCGSIERYQRGANEAETWPLCIDTEACARQQHLNEEEERKRISFAIQSGDAW